MKKLRIDESAFRIAIEGDRDFMADPQDGYLDKKTGRVLFVADDDEEAASYCGIPVEENRELRELVASDGERFVEIPRLGHGGHHCVLQEFLDSEWTKDVERRREAAASYNGSIGRWKADVDEDTRAAYRIYCQEEYDRQIQKLMDDNGIEPDWV